MRPSGNAFDRVKSLLGRMDQSIEDARRRRLHTDQEPQSSPEHTDSEPLGPAEGAPPPPPEPRQQVPLSPPRPPSKYGRAKPIREGETRGPSDSSRQSA